MQKEINERKSRFEERVPCVPSDYENGKNGKPNMRVISLEGKEAERYYPEVANSEEYGVNSLDLMAGRIESIRVSTDTEKKTKKVENEEATK